MCTDEVEFKLISLDLVNLSNNLPYLYYLVLIFSTTDYGTTELMSTAQTTDLPDTTTAKGQYH